MAAHEKNEGNIERKLSRGNRVQPRVIVADLDEPRSNDVDGMRAGSSVATCFYLHETTDQNNYSGNKGLCG